MLILGIETSCDETAASILKKDGKSLSVLSNVVSSQVKIHAKWGGVVPNLAAREHLKNIIPVISQSFIEAGIKPAELDLVAVTQGPGLIPALMVGVGATKTLSYVWKKPLLGIHHIEGHIYANFIAPQRDKIKFPVLCLVVSGGHTQLVLMKKHLRYEIIGQTLDDAAGEAFDKVARILGLGYPGGPIVSAMAQKVAKNKYKILKEKLPRPMLKSNNLNFSFSGLKTAVLYLAKRNEKLLKNKIFIQEVCHEFQQSAIDVLIAKTILAVKKHCPKTVMLAGGVSANQELRKQLGLAMGKNFSRILYQTPDINYSIDNAAMIATAGFYRYRFTKNKKSLLENWKNITASAELKL